MFLKGKHRQKYLRNLQLEKRPHKAVFFVPLLSALNHSLFFHREIPNAKVEATMRIMAVCENPKCGCRVPQKDMLRRYDKDKIRFFCSFKCSALYDFEKMKKVQDAAGKTS